MNINIIRSASVFWENSINPHVSMKLCYNKIRDIIRKCWRVHFPPNQYTDKKYKSALENLKNIKIFTIDEEGKGFIHALENFPSKESDYFESIENLFIELLQVDVGDIREHYERIHTLLRKALESDGYTNESNENKPFRKFLQDLCVAKFIGNEMFDHHKSFLESKKIVFIPSGECSDNSSFADQVKAANEKLKEAPEKKDRFSLIIQKLEGQGVLNGDNIGRSNVPEVRCRHKYLNKTVTVARHGTIAISPEGILKIAPEYECFLDALEEKRENVLYVNHQRYDSSQLGVNQFDRSEITRSKMIHKLGEKHNNFHAVSLPMNGPLFKFHGKFDEFKKLISESILNEKYGFKFPKEFHFPEGEIEKTLKNISLLFFDSKESFSREDSQEFLMIFYSFLKERMKSKLNIHVMGTVCKDNKDRGNVSSGVDELLIGAYSGKLNDPFFLEELGTRFLGAFMIKNEEVRENDYVPLFSRIIQRVSRSLNDLDSCFSEGKSMVNLDDPLLGINSAIDSFVKGKKFSNKRALKNQSSENPKRAFSSR